MLNIHIVTSFKTSILVLWEIHYMSSVTVTFSSVGVLWRYFSFSVQESADSLECSPPVLPRCSHVSDLPAGFSVCPPVLLQSSLEFPFSQAQTKLRHQAGQGRISPCGAGKIITHTHFGLNDQKGALMPHSYHRGVTDITSFRLVNTIHNVNIQAVITIGKLCLKALKADKRGPSQGS